MAEYKNFSCPERTFYDSITKECLPCPGTNCLKCIGKDGDFCVEMDEFSFVKMFRDYWVLFLIVLVSIVLIMLGCKYLYKLLFMPTIIREGCHSIDEEMKLHFAENPIANPYTYIVDYVNA
uniref:Uncharacterized protein n=1 Tax=Panagrolaimus davidi TaxID=227884 RepID=A0A914PYS1_9BILA